MSAPQGPPSHRALTRVTEAIAVAAWGLATLSLIGWVSGWTALCNLVPGYPGMNPLTAIEIILCAVALWRLRGGQPLGRLGLACAGTAAGVALLRCYSIAAGIEPGPDLWLFHSQLAAAPFASRMGVHTTLALLCVAVGLLTIDVVAPRGIRPASFLAPIGFAIGMAALVGYLYTAAAMYGLMAISTACALLLLSAGMFVARPDRGLCRLVTRASPGGIMARTLLPTAVLLPIAFGWLRLFGQKEGLYGLEMGTAMLASAIVLLLVVQIWVTGHSLDATNRKRREAEDALGASRNRERRLLETNIIGVLSAVDGLIVEANTAFLEMIGRTPADLPVRWETITPPEWHGHSENALREIEARGVTTPFEKEYLHKDGSRVPALVGAATVPGAKGEVMAFVVDLRGARQAERETQRMRVFLDSVIENLPNMVFVKDAQDLRFVRFNRAGEALLGFPRETLIGKSDRDFFPADQADFFIAKDRAVLEARQPLDIPEESIRTSSGDERILHTQKVPILDGDGTPLYLLGISQDITERKHAERERAALTEGLRRRTAELQAVNEALEAFSYSVSHDLRAPLRHIDGFADLLARHAGPALDEKGRRHLQVISDSAKSMGELIDDLLAFSRMSRTRLQREPVDLGLLIEDVRRGLDVETANRKITWRLGPLPVVEGDRAMLRLVFTNLLSNAVKYSRPRDEAEIEVGSEEREDGVVVFVRDNGVGFDMKYAHKLFGVFQRLHRDDEFEGTGIGLANVQRVVQRHGGRTWAEGVVDRGSTFYVALPRAWAIEDLEEAA